MLTKQQLRVLGGKETLMDFLVGLGVDEHFVHSKLSICEEESELLNFSFKPQLDNFVPLPDITQGNQVVAALDTKGTFLEKKRFTYWGVADIPDASVKKIWGEQSMGGAVVGFDARCEGNFVPWVKAAASNFSSLTFRLMWVNWPNAVASNAGVFFPEQDIIIGCPSSRSIEQFVRSMGWLGDKGFNDNFFYLPVQGQRLYRST